MLHPVRMRILQSFMGQRQITAGRLSELLPDVPQATLYRHLNKLTEAGILAITHERKVRGATEKTFALSEENLQLSPEEMATLSREEHLRYFSAFLTTVASDFQRYLQQDQFDLAADGVGYRQFSLYLSDEEFVQLAQMMNSVFMQAIKNEPAPGRRLRKFTSIVMPDPATTNLNE